MVVNGLMLLNSDGNFEWVIYDVMSCLNIRSSTFEYESVPFHLRLSVHSKEDRLQLAIHTYSRLSEGFHVTLQMATGINGSPEIRKGLIDENGIFYVRRWMPWTEMLKRRLEILSDGRLCVRCTIWKGHTAFIPYRTPALEHEANREERELSDGDEEGTSSDQEKHEIPEEGDAVSCGDSDEEETMKLPKSVKKLQIALKALLISGEDSDVTIKVQGKEFPAHRGILRVRSPVFDSMFNHEMAEKQTGLVVIDDCDPETFPDFLKHVYTGKTSHISAENVFDLYTASDKYGLDELKEACLEFMNCNLTVQTFCDTIALALKHNENELTGLATEFFSVNALEIIDTEEWHLFLAENPTAGNKLFRKILMK